MVGFEKRDNGVGGEWSDVCGQVVLMDWVVGMVGIRIGLEYGVVD